MQNLSLYYYFIATSLISNSEEDSFKNEHKPVKLALVRWIITEMKHFQGSNLMVLLARCLFLSL